MVELCNVPKLIEVTNNPTCSVERHSICKTQLDSAKNPLRIFSIDEELSQLLNYAVRISMCNRCSYSNTTFVSLTWFISISFFLKIISLLTFLHVSIKTDEENKFDVRSWY